MRCAFERHWSPHLIQQRQVTVEGQQTRLYKKNIQRPTATTTTFFYSSFLMTDHQVIVVVGTNRGVGKVAKQQHQRPLIIHATLQSHVDSDIGAIAPKIIPYHILDFTDHFPLTPYSNWRGKSTAQLSSLSTMLQSVTTM